MPLNEEVMRTQFYDQVDESELTSSVPRSPGRGCLASLVNSSYETVVSRFSIGLLCPEVCTTVQRIANNYFLAAFFGAPLAWPEMRCHPTPATGAERAPAAAAARLKDVCIYIYIYI